MKVMCWWRVVGLQSALGLFQFDRSALFLPRHDTHSARITNLEMISSLALKFISKHVRFFHK